LDEEVSQLREECEEGEGVEGGPLQEQQAEWKAYKRARVGTDL